MTNFELIDDYLTNRLSDQDKKAFELQLMQDQTLKAEVELQKQIIAGLKSARAAELKTMLNNVPVTGFKYTLSPLRLAGGLIGTAIIATSLYFYFSGNKNDTPAEISTPQTDSIVNENSNNVEPIEMEETKPEEKETITSENSDITATIKSEKQTEESKAETKSNPLVIKKENRPAIDLVDPSDELSDIETVPTKSGSSRSSISIAKVDVDVVTTERKLKSHYQFVNDRLVLYGDFDKSLYEIIEVNGDKARSLFLYYQNTYYLLDENQHEVTVLKEISDPVLIQKLKAFRSN